MHYNVPSNAKGNEKRPLCFNNWDDSLLTTHFPEVVRRNTQFTLHLSRDQCVKHLQNNGPKPLEASCKPLRNQWFIHQALYAQYIFAVLRMQRRQYLAKIKF